MPVFHPIHNRTPRLLRGAWAVGLAVLLLIVSAPGAFTAGAAQGVTCASFSYQEDAQAVLDAGAGDRLGLDPDGDGIACNELPRRNGDAPAAPSPTATPRTTFADPIAADVDGFWRRTFKRNERSYASPRALVASDGQTPTPCGVLAPFPALYCPPDGSIYYDAALLAGPDRDGYGRAAWVMTVSHEWGHRAQDLLGLLDEYHDGDQPTAFSMALEIQAQCAAGAYVRDALRRDVLRQIEADRVDLVAHTVLGDGIHGTSTLNVDAYERGRTKGLRACGYEF
jgi:predicted metalloprotease